ncbi:MAG TPA: hypothetical protein VHR66_30360 [Gemmataceae bacterium]|jgi:hypothetical protein|nr:hypothetical protein [Gemmataceae bacterium]
MSAILEEPAHADAHDEPSGSLTERLRHLEGEVAELRHTLSELAEIVVGDIRDRRDAAIAVNAPVPELSIPASLVPGGQTTLNAVNALRRPWLLVDLMRDFGSTVRMYMDPRYRVRRSTQLMVPLILLLFGANYVLFNHTLLDIPIFKHILERVFEIVLAILLYKVVMREVVRYRQMVAGVLSGLHARPVPVSLVHNDPDTAAHSRLETH